MITLGRKRKGLRSVTTKTEAGQSSEAGSRPQRTRIRPLSFIKSQHSKSLIGPSSSTSGEEVAMLLGLFRKKAPADRALLGEPPAKASSRQTMGMAVFGIPISATVDRSQELQTVLVRRLR
jgi:hypothetical protein